MLCVHSDGDIDNSGHLVKISVKGLPLVSEITPSCSWDNRSSILDTEVAILISTERSSLIPMPHSLLFSVAYYIH